MSGKIRGVAGLTTTTTDRYLRPLVGAYALFVLCLIFISSFIDRQIVGQLAPLDAMHDLLARNQVDLIAVGRGLLADPEWGSKVRDGRLLERREFRTEMRGRLE